MIKNYIKIALRFLKKHKLITTINILSLSIGISATLVIFLMIQHDYSFDQNVPNQERIYRIVNDGEYKNAGVITPLVRSIEEEVPNIETIAPIFKSYVQKIKIGSGNKNKYQIFPKEEKIVLTNSQYFDIFPFKWLSGNAKELNQIGTIVLTKKTLERYYGITSPAEVIGKVILYADSISLQVVGVVDNPIGNSDFSFDSFISQKTIEANTSLKDLFNWDAWNSVSDAHQVLIKTKQGTSTKTIESNIASLIKKHKASNGEKITDKFILQPLGDVHFNTTFNYGATKPETLRNLILLAFFLLALGAVNFINLSTAQATERAKEVGIRKTLGSSKSTLIKQFLVETFLITLIATILSAILLPLFLHVFDGFIPSDLQISNLPKIAIGFFLLAQLIIITLLAGFYPAWILTGYAPVLALKNQQSQNSNLSRSAWIRKALTIFQFVLAQSFLICVLIVIRQINYVSQKDMGFQKDAIVNLYIPGAFQNSDKGNLLKDKLKNLPEIKAVSFGNIAPAMNGYMQTSINLDNSNDPKELLFDSRSGDENYLAVYHIPLIAGRNIRLLDSTSEVLINEKGLALLNIKHPEDAIGKTFDKGNKTIVGVMKDFDIASAHQAIKPLLYFGNKDGYVLHIALDKAHPENWKNTINKITTTYKTIFPDDDIDLQFLDEVIKKFYDRERELSTLLTWAVGLSILIASLGLFGLAIFTANQRTKEIGIRKVLGATIMQIVFLLLKNLVVLVGIACLIAFPIAYYAMHKWLEDFAYKTDINLSIFALSAVGLIAFACFVLSTKSIMAAMANPVDSLRDE
ncbi:ABC transporter permease [Sphingobacterium sp. SRCM116780]|uniref:ABC transporter permease n=1 Tax=Sphingobacterium sp. SRCM116780 TaxID=2907623 RepID=UPI001F16AFE1|nr:ABC transporter permease [Sphingobacterium sp. SRCM116780]UIR55120.1 ABC transporter permease [Sphingobacterium sp. SRCM116780]